MYQGDALGTFDLKNTSLPFFHPTFNLILITIFEKITRSTMTLFEKRNFIQNHLHLAREQTINEFYEKLRKEEALKAKTGNQSA